MCTDHISEATYAYVMEIDFNWGMCFGMDVFNREMSVAYSLQNRYQMCTLELLVLRWFIYVYTFEIH